MPHIVIDARIISSTTGRYVERLLTNLQKIDHKNTYTVLVPSRDKDFWKPLQSNFTIKTANVANYSLAEQTKMLKLLNDLRPDLVHFCMPQQPVLYRGKKVTTIHDLTLFKTYNSDKNWAIYHAKQLVGRFVFRHVTATSNHIIAVSNYTKQEILKTFSRTPHKAISVIYESADSATGKTKNYPHLPFKKYLLYVGQQSDYKNIKRLGDAHQLLLAKYPDLGLVLVGKINATAKNNKDYFNKRHYQSIHFTGFVPDNQLNWLYTHAAAYVFPSLMEGFGLPGLEAMAYGTPVISSNATCLPEIYGKAAHYFDPTDTSAMAQAIDDILSDSKQRDRLIQNGHAQLKKYSWERLAQETLAVYEKVLRG